MARDAALVVVDAQVVDRLSDEPQVRVGHSGPRCAEQLGQLRRVGAAQHRFEKQAVHVRVGAARRIAVLGRVARRMLGLQVQHDADVPFALGAVGLDGRAVGAEQVVRDARPGGHVAVSRREGAVHVAAVHDDPRLVDRRPQRHAVSERAEHHAGIIGEPVGHVTVEPAAVVVEGGGEVPVIEGDGGLDAAGEQRVDEAVVERDAARVHRAAAHGEDAAPRDAEAVGVEPEVGEQRHVLGEAVIVVARDVARVAVGDVTAPRRMREAVPDARPGAVGERRAFDLVGGRGGAPEKVSGKAIHLTHRSSWRA